MENESKKIAEAAAVLGQIKTPAKAAASRANGANGGRPVKPLEEIVCSCGATDNAKHQWRCLRGQAYRRRIARGLPVEKSAPQSEKTEKKKTPTKPTKKKAEAPDEVRKSIFEWQAEAAQSAQSAQGQPVE